MPTLSIITPCLNAVGSLRVALDSVPRAVDGCSIEHIVVDGGSSDGSLQILENTPGLTLIQGRDRNLYDAINKGLAVAKGDFVGLLNADDYYPEGTLERVIAALVKAPHAKMLCGSALVLDMNGKCIASHTSVPNRNLAVSDLLLGVPIINARFFSRDLIDSVGYFDIRLPLAADRDWLLRAALVLDGCTQLESVTYIYQQHLGSLTIGSNDARLRIARDHLDLVKLWWSRRDVLPGFKDALLELYAHAMLTGAYDASRSFDFGTLRRLADRSPVPTQSWLLKSFHVLRERFFR